MSTESPMEDATTTYPLPEVTRFDKPFWDACQAHTLTVFECSNCSHRFLPGAPNCPRCWEAEISTRPVSGKATVFTFAIYRRTYHPAIRAPYVVALITLDEGPCLVSNIVGCPPEDVYIGMRVRVHFEEEAGFILPRFEPAPDEETTLQEAHYD